MNRLFWLGLITTFFFLQYKTEGAAFRSGLESRYYNEPTEIQNLWVIGRCWFHPNGNLKNATLAKRDTLMGNILPKGTIVELTADKLLLACILPYDMTLQGVPLRGGSSDWMVNFYPGTGKIRSGWLSRDAVLDSIPCAKSTVIADLFLRGGGIFFHSNGKLRSARLARDFMFQGKKFKKGDRIWISNKGKVYIP
ncbi:MAG: hypothetical protein N2450_05050 [bacterium]|nr:hypothetical protein [bacterium]